MGMYDTLLAADGSDWQTKALDDPYLRDYHIGDRVDVAGPNPDCYEDYQIHVIGDSPDRPGAVWRFATIRGGCLSDVPVDRDPSLPLADYHGGFIGSGD